MTKKQAIKDSVSHWEAMIKWAKTRYPKDWPDPEKMEATISEDWYSNSCPLCQWRKNLELNENEYKVNSHYCDLCPLSKKYGKCSGDDEVNAWDNTNSSPTWSKWLVNAKIMLKQLRSIK